jgi:asparagine synthase (glutamine-hydrolysing)
MSMLAGIYDSRRQSSEADVARRVRNAFGRDTECRACYVGPLAVVSDRLGGNEAAGCALEGSVYNHPELAEELGEDPGLPTETLLARGYQRWGDGMLARLRGAFALVAWTAGGTTILLAQDQVGVGALFLHRSGQELVFGSEIHHLLRLLIRTPAPDEVSLVRWIASEDHQDGLTMFHGVRRLGTGRRISIVEEREDLRRYWMPAYQPPLEGSRLEIAAQLKDSLSRAIAMRTRRIDSVGITLSGGFDSSAVAAVAATTTSRDQDFRGYSTVFPDDPEMDDRDYLDVLATALPLKNIRYKVEPGGALEVALEYLRDWSLPLSGPGWVTELPLIRRAATDGIQVMLDGQGGDETFGVVPFLVADLIRAGRLVSAVSLVRHGFPGAGNGAAWRPTARVLAKYGLRPALPFALYSLLRRLRTRHHESPRFLNDPASMLLAQNTNGLGWTRSGREPRWWLGLRRVLIDDREAVGLGDFIRQRAKWVGIEARPPLFDVDLIETALRVPPQFRFDPYLDRPIGREALAGVLPDPIRLSHRKSNLAPLYHRGLTGPDLPLIRRLLGGDRLEIAPWVRPDVVRGLIEHPPSVGGPNWYEWLSAVWGCVTAECWLRSLSEPVFAEMTLEESAMARLEYSEVA